MSPICGQDGTCPDCLAAGYPTGAGAIERALRDGPPLTMQAAQRLIATPDDNAGPQRKDATVPSLDALGLTPGQRAAVENIISERLLALGETLVAGEYDLHDSETRVTDAATGGQKGVKLTQLGALDPVSLIEASRVAGYGAAKYAAFNYLRGYDWAHSFNAMQRHALLFWAGEDFDEESELHHMAHAAWHCLALVSFALRGVGTDTRPPRL